MTSKAAIGATRAPRATLQSCPTARDTPVTHRAALATAAVLLLAAALLVACGGSSSSSTSSTSTAKAKSGSGGAAVFTAAGCGGCHTLAGAHSHAMVGPNLDQLKPNTATVAKQVENGGDGMPVFRGQLTPAQIHAVAQFVAQNASNSSARASGSACSPWTCATPAEASVWLPVSSTLAGRPTQQSDPRCAGYRSARGGGVGVSPFGEDRGSGRAWTGAPAFLFRRGSARFAMGRVSRLSPRSREHFRARATGRDALRGTRKPSACRLSVGRGPSPFVVPVAVPVTDRSPQVAGR